LAKPPKAKTSKAKIAKPQAPAPAPRLKKPQPAPQQDPLLKLVLASLDDDKAEDVSTIPLAGKSSVADYLVIASGRSTRQVATMAQHLRDKIKAAGRRTPAVEGLERADWVLVDAGDVVAHLFRPEVRSFYNLEKMWNADLTPGTEPAKRRKAPAKTQTA
jgi:ribosome-associated protein